MRILVTGAASGLGAALTRSLVAGGHEVVGVDIRSADADGAADATFIKADISDATAVRRLAVSLKNTPLDGVINNAGIGSYAPVTEMSVDDWQRSLAVNVTAPFLLARQFGPDLISKKGFVINIGSTRAYATAAGYGAYCASKFALRGLTYCLARELAGEGVRVSLVNLGPMLTDFGGRLGERQERAQAGEPILPPPQVAAWLANLIENKIAWREEFVLVADRSGAPRLISPNQIR